jgi:uncharacterized protein YukE/uncharacterized membrane protein
VTASPTPPGSFAPLDGRNGVPGDAGAVSDLARRYADTAAEIEAQAANLRKLTSQARGGWKGEAGEKFSEAAGDLADRISKARRRYEAAGEALASFADALVGVQTLAYGAVRAAQEADDEVRRLQANRPTPARGGTTPAEAAIALEEQRAHTTAVEDARTRLSTARNTYETAVQDYDRAARDAAGILGRGREDDGLADSWWDRNAGWIGTALDVIGVVVLVIAIAALVIAVFVPGLNALVLAGLTVGSWLGWAGFALTAFSFGGHLALYLNAESDRSDLVEDMVWDVVGMATFGLGFAVAPVARAVGASASRLGQGIAATRGARAAFSGAGLPRVLFDLGRSVPLARDLLSLSSRVRSAFSAADEAAESARAAVAEVTGNPGLGSRILALGDEDLAALTSLASRLDEAVPDSVRLSAVELLSRVGAVGWGWGVQGGSAVQSGVSSYEDRVSGPAEDAARDDWIADTVDRWSLPLLHTR